jgi:hypothetical protein
MLGYDKKKKMVPRYSGQCDVVARRFVLFAGADECNDAR